LKIEKKENKKKVNEIDLNPSAPSAPSDLTHFTSNLAI